MRDMASRSCFILLVLTLAVILPVKGQQAREVFGKNRIQYRQFDWVYLSGENFDVYYYDARKAVASDALEYLETEFERITDLIGYPPYFKTKVFLYNSLADLRQSNVGLNHTIFNVGGETEFIKPYVEVAHLGTVQEFKEELLFKISELMVNEMMFGGNLKDMFQSSILMNLPDWFVNGASQYVAKGWDAKMDDYIRQLIVTRRARKATKLSGVDAALVGQSIWNFIAEKFGKSSVANILNYTRVTRNEEKSILITLGITFKQLIAEWRAYYIDMEKVTAESYVFPNDTTTFTQRHNRTTEFTTVKISPDARYIAYAENDRGRYFVKVRDLQSGRERMILNGGSKVIGQRVDDRHPLIAWADVNTLGVIAIRHGEYVFWLYDLQSRTKQPRQLERFSNIRSMEFSSNGRLAVLSADFEGKSDLYLLSTRRDRVRRLTNDLYDDLDPSFIPSTNQVVFSSNRVSDTLRSLAKPEFEKLNNVYNLFIFDLDSTNLLLKRVTNTISKDYAPKAVYQNAIYYLSDQRGIVNIFKYNRSTGIYSQVSNFATSINDFDINFDRNTLAMVMYKDLKQNIFVNRNYNLQRQVFTPATRRKELQQAKVIRDRRKQEENKTMSIKDLLNSRLRQTNNQDSAVNVPSVRDTTDVPVDTVAVTPPADSVQQAAKTEAINTDDYVFEDEIVKENLPTESFLTRYMKARDKSRVTGPFPYETKFSANNLVTNLVVDPLRGLGLSIEAQMNDMLESYRFYGGLMTTVDLRSGDAYAEFQYLPRLVDFSFRFDRKGIRWPNESLGPDSHHFQYSLNKVQLSASLPLTDRIRFTMTPFAALARTVDLGERDSPSTPPSVPPTNTYYAGLKSELVYDNSVTTGLNIIEGSRGKITFQHYKGIESDQVSFSQISADIRHYQKIYREIVFAVRGFAGSFFGNAPKTYLLGGMDNWFFNDSRIDGSTSEGVPNPLGVPTANEDLLFVEFATSLRGFEYATLFGNSVILANAELRVPIIRALSNGPISSNFLRNMQLIAFYDIGTSWSGEPPFTSESSVSYEEVRQTPFVIQIKNYLNPWLYSYGTGIRTVFLGYYVKADFAWPVENYEVGKLRVHVTLGFDF